MLHPKQRQSGKMGKTGRASFKHSADSPCPSGQFPQGDRLGTVYRCRHPDPGRGGPSNRISSLGPAAQMKASMLHNPKHLILEAPHPSPLSAYRGFFGCKHFSKANEFLKANGEEPIDWQIENI